MRILIRTGKLFLLSLWIATFVCAGEFSAELDRSRISMGEAVALSLSGEDSMEGVQLVAPDFEVVNESTSMSMQSYWDQSQGRFVSQTTRKVTKFLSPRKVGTLKILVTVPAVNGKPALNKQLLVQVTPGGSGIGGGRIQNSPPGFFRGQQGRIQGRNQSREQEVDLSDKSNKAAFIRAELDKTEAYKGEQVVVSYYLYHLVKIFNIDVEKYPVLSGFLRQDIDIPAAGQRLSSEQVKEGNALYERSLLAKYAAYPLQNGKLKIDSMALKFNYYAQNRQGADDDDPFFGFFQQMAPRVARLQSDQVEINVKPLPAAPADFSGGVGEFSVLAALNKYEVRANEALTLTVKISGRGNASGIGDPKVPWPASLEMYDAKGKAGSSRDGENERIVEYLLIPRTPGKLTLPAIEYRFFDPAKHQYYTEATKPFEVNVLDPAPGSPLVSLSKAQPAVSGQGDANSGEEKEKHEDLRYLKPPSHDRPGHIIRPIWRVLYWLWSVALAYFVILLAMEFARRRNHSRSQTLKRHSSSSKEWDGLRAVAQNSREAAWVEIVGAYESLCDLVLNAIEKSYGVVPHSLSNSELHTFLVEEKRISPELWVKIINVLESADHVRFAGPAGERPDSSARSNLKRIFDDAYTVVHSPAFAKK